MSDLNKALETQLLNIQKRTGKTLAQLNDIISKSGMAKHGQIRSMLKEELGMGHGDANTVTSLYLNPPEGKNKDEDVLDNLYVGKKADLRKIHELLMQGIKKFGDFEVAPKKAYVSLRRKKQFAMIGPATNTRVEVGINHKELQGTERLLEQKAGSMCQFKVKLTDASQVDDELFNWLKEAFRVAG